MERWQVAASGVGEQGWWAPMWELAEAGEDGAPWVQRGAHIPSPPASPLSKVAAVATQMLCAECTPAGTCG